MVNPAAYAEILSKKYDIPKEEILLIGLNLCGVNYKNRTGIKRGRFRMKPINVGRSFFFAMTVTPDSPYFHDGNGIFLAGERIGSASEIVADTCTDTYHRNHRRHFTINSNMRSVCRGCKFCGTYELKSEENGLLTEKSMRENALELISHSGSVPESIGLVTACFPSEEELLAHLLMLRKVYREFGFSGEIQYVGSQLTSPKALDMLSDGGRFALYFSVEAFTRRDLLMRPEKARIALDVGRNVLYEAARRGMETSMLYILGLDSLAIVEREFPKYLSVLTRHPLVQLMQNYSPDQESLKDGEAHFLDYYLKARKFLEGLFAPRRIYPRGWDNYRAPWFGRYAGKELL